LQKHRQCRSARPQLSTDWQFVFAWSRILTRRLRHRPGTALYPRFVAALPRAISLSISFLNRAKSFTSLVGMQYGFIFGVEISLEARCGMVDDFWLMERRNFIKRAHVPNGR